jgi:hypothetical protein
MAMTHDPDSRDDPIKEHEDLDAETIFEDAEELFSKKAPEGQGDVLQPDNPPPAN